MPRTATRPETIELAGETWTRVEGTMDTVVNEDHIIKVITVDTIRRQLQAEEIERKRTAEFLRDAERAHQRLLAQPVETIGGVQFRTHPDEPDLLVAVSSGTLISRRRVEDITQERAIELAREQRRNALNAAVRPDALVARLAELETQLARSSNNPRKEN